MISSTDGLRLTPGDAVDLQLHTDFSDGRWTLEALLEHLRRERFALAAITDHDRVDTVAVVQQAAREMGVPVLVAVEMTSAWEGGMVDLLCFGFDPAHGALNALAQGLWTRQRENSREVHANLKRLGCDVGHEVLATVIARPSSQQPQAWVDALREAGIGDGGSSAGELAEMAGCSLATNDPVAVVEASHRDGGVPGVRPAARSADQHGVGLARARAATRPLPGGVLPRLAGAAGLVGRVMCAACGAARRGAARRGVGSGTTPPVPWGDAG